MSPIKSTIKHYCYDNKRYCSPPLREKNLVLSPSLVTCQLCSWKLWNSHKHYRRFLKYKFDNGRWGTKPGKYARSIKNRKGKKNEKKM